MTYPIPSGTRDVLPDEMRELRAIESALRATFERLDYGEISTPALEYEDTLARADVGDAKPTYRLFDEQGAVLVLRSDMTVPIARVVGTRYPTAPLPLRFYYLAHAYRGVRPQRGQPREFLQGGIELVGLALARGHDRGAQRALRGAGRRRARGLPRRARRRVAVPDPAGRLGRRRAARPHPREPHADFAGLEREVARLDVDPDPPACSVRVPRCGRVRRCSATSRAGWPTRRWPACARARGRGRQGAPAGDRRPRLGARARVLHRRRVRGLRPRPGGAAGGGGRYDDLPGPVRARAARGGLRAERRAPAHRAWEEWGREPR